MESIYAIDSNNGLSKKNIIPWKSKTDMLFFMNKTKNNIVIMGRNTFFSLPKENRPLKNRLNIVITNNPHLYLYEYPSVLFTNNVNIYQDIFKYKSKYIEQYIFLNKDFKIFIIGGKTIYEQFIPLCDKVWITQIKNNYDCDLFIDYDYSKNFSEKLYKEDNELKIIEYIRNK
jgi:dihydrofolate reductase